MIQFELHIKDLCDVLIDLDLFDLLITVFLEVGLGFE